MTLVEYGDYECPYCRQAAPIIRALLERFEGELRFVFRHLPLVDVHPYAALAAEAAEAAGAQGSFWEMHDFLFEHQQGLDQHDLVGLAVRLGLDDRAFAEALRNGRFSARVAQDVNSAGEAGVAGTPSFFVNGIRYRGAVDFTALEVRIASASRMARLRGQRAAELSSPGR